MKKRTQNSMNTKNVPFVQFSLGRKELNALMHSLDQNKSVLDGILEDSAIDLQTKILQTGRYSPENKGKSMEEVVSLQFVGEEITLMLQQFVGTSLYQSGKNTEEVADFFESIKQDKRENLPTEKNKED